MTGMTNPWPGGLALCEPTNRRDRDDDFAGTENIFILASKLPYVSIGKAGSHSSTETSWMSVGSPQQENCI